MAGHWVTLLLLGLVTLSASFLLNGTTKKKGFAIYAKHYYCADFAALKGTHWWYDWTHGTQKYIDQCKTGVSAGYVPMVWGWHKNGQNNGHDFGHYDTVLGFNEPNHRKQSNITYEQAARFWPVLEKQAGSRTLVSPSAAPCGNSCQGNVIPWFTGFFQECKGCRVDYLATHYYGCNADHAMAYLKDLWNRFHRKIWLTEFNCNQGGKSHILQYMKHILPRLEAAPFVHRYAWFGNHLTDAGLLESNSSALTELGRFYMQF
ncbi:uncharacterized protein [Littorina saxatilis]|uniref:Asl1-like glycosyl hydrolase catalytic domain-containing protein n=1 Tax=Littorina saxatilis TaxID=31220 RepID=A0AAN9G7D8_9CAEN